MDILNFKLPCTSTTNPIWKLPYVLNQMSSKTPKKLLKISFFYFLRIYSLPWLMSEDNAPKERNGYDVSIRFKQWFSLLPLQNMIKFWPRMVSSRLGLKISGPSDKLDIRVQIKEGCNWGHGLSAAIKLGSLEKTITASLFHSGLHSGTIFLWKKQCHMVF